MEGALKVQGGIRISLMRSKEHLIKVPGSSPRTLNHHGTVGITPRLPGCRPPTPDPAPAALVEDPTASPAATTMMDSTVIDATAASTTVSATASDPFAAPSLPAIRVDAHSDDCGVIQGRPDLGGIFRDVLHQLPPPPGAVGVAGGMRPGDGTVVFACGPAGMIREVQVRA
jgi:hypothetical protein